MSKTGKSPMLRAWVWLRPVVVIVVVTCAMRSSLADWNDVPTGSMNPTILEGDRIFVNKLAYDLKVPFTTWRLARWSAPRRGDIVTFRSPADGKRLVKRVVGLPGDRIELRNDVLYVNGQAAMQSPDGTGASGGRTGIPAEEDLAGRMHPIQLTPATPALRSFGPLTVPGGHYFMMGDNRDNSFDSRYFGPVALESIYGRALAVAVSVDPSNCYLPRWSRFFQPLP